MNDDQVKKTVKLTQTGLAELKTELGELLQVKLPSIIDRVATARAHGDLKENAEYHAAKEEQQLTQTRIDQIQDILARVQVVKQTTSHTKVGIGSKVTVRRNDKKTKEKIFQIMGEFEAKPIEGKISSSSPMGLALMGKGPGDTVVVESPAGKVKWIIKSIE